MSHLFPMFLKLSGRPCLVVGAGTIAEPKIASLVDSGARVKVVAPKATEQIQAWASKGQIDWQPRPFRLSDIEDCFLVIAATSDIEVNDTVYRQAQTHHVLCNAVDDPERCDFYYPAVVRRGSLQIAVSTAGRSPALAQRLRRELEDQFGPEYADWLEKLGRDREDVRNDGTLSVDEQRRVLHSQASAEAFRSFMTSPRLALETKEAQDAR